MPLPCVEIETAPHPTHAVIWLHGLGADGHDFEPIVPQLVDQSWPPLRFVFPHAPVRPVTINGGARMRAWYDIAGADIAARQDAEGVHASIGLIEELIAREGTRGIDSDKVLLAGFSQGGAIALAAGLRHATRLAGIIALSSYLPLHETTANERAVANADLPIFMGHGSHDPVVPEALGEMSRDVLRSLGYRVEWHSYAMAHQVCAEEVADLRAWLTSHFAPAQS
ncbi:MAG: alpha/beta hydrolase-fold protein [Rhodanobacteraceae bacterium]